MSALALATGMLALLAGGLALYARHTVLDERAFADRATRTLAQPDVTEEIAARIAGRAVAAEPRLARVRPALDAAVVDVVSEPAFAAEFHAGAARLHHVIFYEGKADPPLDLPGAGSALQAAVARRAPAAATLLPGEDPNLLHLGGGALESGLRHAGPLARRLSALGPIALVIALLALGFAAATAPTRRIGLRRAAWAVAAVGAGLLAAIVIARALVLSTFDSSHGDAVVGTIWSAYLDDLRVWALAAAGLGALTLVATQLRSSRFP